MRRARVASCSLLAACAVALACACACGPAAEPARPAVPAPSSSAANGGAPGAPTAGSTGDAADTASIPPFSSPSPLSSAAPATPAPSAPHPGDAAAAWLRGHGWENVVVGHPSDELLTIRVSEKPVSASETRRAFALRVAHDVATAAGFPALDVIETTDYGAREVKQPARLRHVELHASAPPLDGACIDPQVDIELGETQIRPPTTSFWLSEVRVLCEREPQGGPQPPDTATRTLPRAAKRAAPFLAMCRTYNFVGGRRSDGWALDKKGDVYAFSGGRFTPPRTQRQLGVLVRHARKYAGTLAPADVDRLVELMPQVEREALSRKAVQAPDRAGGGCALLKGGGPDDLGTIELASASATGEAARSGAASTEAAKLVEQANALAQGH